MSATSSSSPRVKKPLSWTATTLIFSNVALLGMVGWAYVRFGSIPRALAYASGQRLLVDSNTKSFGTVQAGAQPTVSFRLKNMSNRPIELIGAKASCSCVVIEALPLTIRPNQTHDFKILVRTANKKGDFSQSTLLFTDINSQSSFALTLKIVGIVNSEEIRETGTESGAKK